MTSSYVAATSVDEAVAAMADGARPVAGGTDLVVGARQGKAPLPQSLVAIHRLDELRSIEAMDGALRLGALASHEDIAESQVVCERLTALADASAIVGSHATRAQGTLGGNLMNASPAMETGGAPPCFDATGTPHGPHGVPWGAGAGLFARPRPTTPPAHALLTTGGGPPPPAGAGSGYRRVGKPQQEEVA